ncbi:hypothetical protein FC093_22665 [Ilyomonas limi]|uniref:RHS repeat protein n=1 Tax=Ilyomonas limi TaxID=2575867 RepID=A0A4U3KRW2_9BACT|nr:hypothetical protein [Ilyomonas limi]TKK64359.1 hypothetical protein FC093_22665 [Ilyomonas limi]
MRTSKLLIVLLFLSSYSSVHCQLIKQFLPSLAPASPEASSFTKYGNYDVNLFTGIPNITIPLYEIQVGELKVPITLNYHTSGIKITDIPSRVGLGWDLQAGGSITRKIMGKPDELSNNYLSQTSESEGRVRNGDEIPATIDGLRYLDNVHRQFYDVEPDIFSYNFPGQSGKFLFNQKDNYKAYFIPYAPVSVTYNRRTESIMDLSMKDESGANYTFGAQEWTESGGGNPIACTSAWLLTDMTSANLQDNIHFAYTQRSGSGITDSYYSDYMTFTDASNNSTIYQADNTNGKFYWDYSTVSTWWQQLDEIDFKNGKVVFRSDPQQSRADFGGQYQLQHQLNAIEIYSYNAISATYALIRTIKFNYGYFIKDADINTKRLRLDNVQFVSPSNEIVQTYTFNYNNSIALPSNISRMKDYWGYFNNQLNYIPGTQTETGVPQRTITAIDGNSGAQFQATVGGTNPNAREPNMDYMQAYILQRITYPTGGYTQFEYETNKYLDDDNNPKYAGGLRIASISNYTSSTATPIKKVYTYGNNESGYGRMNFAIEERFFTSIQNLRYGRDGSSTCISPVATCTQRTYFANPTNDLEGWDGAPVVYPTVTEYTINGTFKNGKTVYTFSDKEDAKTSIIGLGIPHFDSYHFIRGLLRNKAVYKISADQVNYTLLTESKKEYQFFPYQWSVGGIGLVVYKKLITQDYLYGDIFCGSSTEDSYNDLCHSFTDEGNYSYNSYNIVSGDNKLISETNIVYDQSDPTKSVSTITTYTYDDLDHLQLASIQTTNSKAQKVTTTNTYPYNYTTSPYTEMAANHIFDKVVSSAKIIGTSPGTPLTAQYNNYKNSSLDNYVVGSIQTTTGSNPKKDRAYFNGYDDRGNILDMQKTNDIHMSYEWGYDNMYVVAQVSNAQNSWITKTKVISQVSAGLTVGANSTNSTSIEKQIEVAQSGSVIITLGNSQTTQETVTGSITITKPDNTNVTQSVSVILGKGCDNGATITFNNIPTGTNTVEILLNSNSHPFGFCGTVKYPGEIINVNTEGVKEFFYNSFEDITGNEITSNTCAGKVSYDNSGTKYVVPFQKPNSREYIIDYHYRSNGKWIAVTKPFTNNMTLNEGDGIDEVRVYPKDGQMITFSYEPLIGLTGQCDAANRITYYEYDGIGRLARIRDMDNNILKQYCYNYDGQNAPCNVPFCVNAAASYSNSIPVKYTVVMTNTATSANYTFTINAATSSGAVTGNQTDIPSGIYNITMTPPKGTNQSVTFQAGDITQQGTSFSAFNISVECPNTLPISIHN